MLPVYSAILSYYGEPKDMYQVCSLFANILSGNNFWKERHDREGLPSLRESSLSLLKTYYLAREFAQKDIILECHLSKLPFFPSFAQGEEYYARAVKFRREQVPQSINRIVLHRCVYFYPDWSALTNYINKKTSVDFAIQASERALGVKDPEHPSLDVSCKLWRKEFAMAEFDVSKSEYVFYLYLDLDDDEGGRVDVPVEEVSISVEQAFSFYLQTRL